MTRIVNPETSGTGRVAAGRVWARLRRAAGRLPCSIAVL